MDSIQPQPQPREMQHLPPSDKNEPETSVKSCDRKAESIATITTTTTTTTPTKQSVSLQSIHSPLHHQRD